MRILLIMAVVFGGLWLVDSFGFSGKHFKEVRQEAWILCFLPEVSDGEDYGRAVTAALQGGVIAPVVDLTTPSSNEQKYRAPLKLTFCGVAMML